LLEAKREGLIDDLRSFNPLDGRQESLCSGYAGPSWALDRHCHGALRCLERDFDWLILLLDCMPNPQLERSLLFGFFELLPGQPKAFAGKRNRPPGYCSLNRSLKSLFSIAVTIPEGLPEFALSFWILGDSGSLFDGCLQIFSGPLSERPLKASHAQSNQAFLHDGIAKGAANESLDWTSDGRCSYPCTSENQQRRNRLE
jgi:hypothetical protein